MNIKASYKLITNNTLVYFSIAILSIFILQNHKNGFEAGHHGNLSSHGATLAKNITLKHNLLMFDSARMSDDKIIYDPYNRFPFFTFLILKIVMMIFEPNLALQIYASRQVMNIFFSMSLLLCFLMTKEILNKSHLSLATTLLSFSSYFLLFYSDMIFNDIPALFGYLLAFFIVVKSNKNKLTLSHIILLSILSISAGWQPYSVFVSWFFIDLFKRIRQNGTRHFKIKSLLSRPSFIALTTIIIWGILILSFQLINEWVMTGNGFWSLDTVRMFVFRIGAAPADQYNGFADMLRWSFFIGQQVYRIIVMILPIPLDVIRPLYKNGMSLKLLIVILATCLYVGIFFLCFKSIGKRHKLDKYNLAIFLVSGFLWAVPMKYFVVFHDFQSIFYIGIPIVFYTAIVFCLRRMNRKFILLITLAVFITNLSYINYKKNSVGLEVNYITAEFQNIYNTLPKNSKVCIDRSIRSMAIGEHAIDFYLSGHYFTDLENAEYLISKNKMHDYSRLTDNKNINLFKK